MSEFGDRLRKLRKSRDITQEQLAQVIGVVPSAVGKYERMEGSYPSVDALIKISNYFEVSTDFLLKGVEMVPAPENNITGQLLNSNVVQANHGSVVYGAAGNYVLTPEAMELIRIYESLSGRDRLKLLNIAVELEGGSE